MFKNILIGLMSLTLLIVTPMAVVDHTTLRTMQLQAQIEAARPPVSLPFDLIRKVTKRIYIEELGNGSGVMIGPRRMLTAAHVAVIHTPENPLMVDGKPIVKVLKIDEVNDLAIIEVDVKGPYISIGKMPVNDTKVTLVGFPSYPYIGEQIVTEGRTMGLNHDKTRIVATTPASPGNSGGGLFAVVNGKWVLVGILTSTAGTTLGGMFPAMVYHLSLSVDVDTIKKFLK